MNLNSKRFFEFLIAECAYVCKMHMMINKLAFLLLIFYQPNLHKKLRHTEGNINSCFFLLYNFQINFRDRILQATNWVMTRMLLPPTTVWKEHASL